MDKIEKIRQEIERLKKYYAECGYPGMGEYEQGNKQGRMETLEHLLSFLDTLSEEPDKSLEEAAEEYIKNGRYFPEAWVVRPAFIAGAEWQKSQMLKDTVGGMVCATITNQVAISFFSPLPKELKAGDKVRIVVLREEEE